MVPLGENPRSYVLQGTGTCLRDALLIGEVQTPSRYYGRWAKLRKSALKKARDHEKDMGITAAAE